MIRKWGREEPAAKRGPKADPIEAYDLATKQVLLTFQSIPEAQAKGYDGNAIRRVIRGRHAEYRGLAWLKVGALPKPEPSVNIEPLIQNYGLRNAILIAAG